MNVKLLTEHHLGFPSLKGGCRGSSESTLVKMRHGVCTTFTRTRIHVTKVIVFSSISGPSGTGNSAGVRGMMRFVAFYVCSH